MTKRTKRAAAPKATAPVETSEERVQAAMGVLSREHRTTIRGSAADRVEELQAGAYDSEEQYTERLEAYVDGHHDVIYTYAAKCVAFISDFDWQAEWKDMGSDKAPTVEQIAYLCILGELREEIENQLGQPVHEWFEAREQAAEEKESDE